MTNENNATPADVSIQAADKTSTIERFASDIQHVQGLYRSQRGKAALALMVATAFTLIERILGELDETVQVIILDQHQVAKAAASSDYTPWIKCFFGEEKAGDKVKALDGFEYAPWEPNPSMAVYHHTMEELRSAGFGATSTVQEIVDHILKAGGSQTMANARKQRLSDKRKRDQAPTVELQRDLYLADGPAITVDLPELKLPAEAGTYIGVVLERVGDSYIVRGVSDRDATAKLNKLAADAFDGLAAARAAAEERQRIEQEAEQRVLDRIAAGGNVAGEQTPNSRGYRLTPEMIARAKAAAAAKTTLA